VLESINISITRKNNFRLKTGIVTGNILSTTFQNQTTRQDYNDELKQDYNDARRFNGGRRAKEGNGGSGDVCSPGLLHPF
jgi:hypothetical protein